MEDEVGIFGMVGYVLTDGGADDVDLEVVFASVTEAGLCECGGQTLVAQFFGDFGVGQLQDISGQGVGEVGDFAVAFDFKAAGGHLLGGARFAAKNIPHGVSIPCAEDCSRSACLDVNENAEGISTRPDFKPCTRGLPGARIRRE